jgi:HK97 family phage major capsid protein
MDYEVKADQLEAVFEGTTSKGPVVRPHLSGARIADPAKAAFVDGYLRRGSEVELKSFSGAVAADGGYAVPKEIDAIIDATLKGISPIRSIANVVRVGSAGYRKLVTQNGVTSGWASETATRPETATPTFNEIVPSFGELYANPAATQAMLDDASFDVEGWLASEIATEFAKAEGAAFVNGNGTNKPRGFLAAPTAVASDATRPFGTLQYIASGAAGAFVASNPQDKLVELVHALRAPYRQGASWVSVRNSRKCISLRGDTTGRSLRAVRSVASLFYITCKLFRSERRCLPLKPHTTTCPCWWSARPKRK